MNASVIIGYPGEYQWTNHNHLGSYTQPFRNPLIQNIAGTYSTTWNSYYIYSSCVNASEPVYRGLINLEVGDEELYLENVTLPWTAQYQTEYDIHINDNNPYYWYEGYTEPTFPRGCYSRNNDYQIQPSGHATFIVDPTSPGIGLTPNPPALDPSRYSETDSPMYICCLNFIGKNANAFLTNSPPENKKYLTISPNPSSIGCVNLDFKFSTIGTKIKINVVNTLGAQVYSKEITIKSATDEQHLTLDLSHVQIKPGVYLIKLSNNSEVLTSKLVVN